MQRLNGGKNQDQELGLGREAPLCLRVPASPHNTSGTGPLLMADRLESSQPGDTSMDSSRNFSDWELLNVSQMDSLSGANTGSGPSSENSAEAGHSRAGISEDQRPSFHAQGQPGAQLDDSFFSGLGVEGFLQADRRPWEGTPQRSAQVQSSGPVVGQGELEHLPLAWKQAGESGVLVLPTDGQIHDDKPVALSSLKEADLDRSQAAASNVIEGNANSAGQEAGSLMGKPSRESLSISQPWNVGAQEEVLQKKEEQQYSDSPVSPLAGPSSFRAGNSLEPPVSGLQHTPDEQSHSEGWTDPEEKSGEESESDLGFDEEGLDNLPVAQAESASQPESSVAGAAGSVEEEEKAPMTVLQKWFPYEAWWQKQETLRRWVRNVLTNQRVTMWSLGLTTAVLAVLLVHQVWRNRDLQAQLRAGNKRLADQDVYIRRLRDMISPRRRVPVIRVTRFSA